LHRELIHNVALRVDDTDDPDKFCVLGHGELHLSILIENMRREGYELGVSRQEVIIREVGGIKQGTVMEKLGERGGDLQDMVSDGAGRVRLDFIMPSKGLIGFRTEFFTATQDNELIYHIFDHYGPLKSGEYGQRNNVVLISNDTGKSLSFALFNLQERGRMLISPDDKVYEECVVGIHSKSNDLVVNSLKAKQLTNIRAAGSDEIFC